MTGPGPAVTVTRADVDAAVTRITGQVRRTPVLRADPLTGSGGPLWFKLEMTQHTGSFKARGAINRLRAAAGAGELTDVGVVAASGGNAGLAVAWAATRLGVLSTGSSSERPSSDTTPSIRERCPPALPPYTPRRSASMPSSSACSLT